MRTTLALDDDLVLEAQRLTGTTEKSALVRQALRALIERESARRLAQLGGSASRSRGNSATADPCVILVDTSVWVDHLRTGNPKLAALLHNGQVLAHPFVLGELALADLGPRNEILGLLANLPQVRTATDPEALVLIENHRLFGRGIGFIDAHLLAATFLTPGTGLWTHDQRLAAVALGLGLAGGP